MEEQGSKLSVKLIAAIVLAIGIVACLAVVLVKADVFAKPEAAVESALLSLSEDKTESAFESVFGLTELFGQVQKQGGELGVGILISDIPGELFGMAGITVPNAGISLTVKDDVKNDRQSIDLDLKAADTKLASLNLYLDQEQLQVAVPQFFTPVLSVPYADPDIVRKVRNSYLGQLAGLEEEYWDMLEENLRIGGNNRTMGKETEKLEAELLKLQKKLYAGMEAKKNGAVTVSAAGDVKCKNYTVVFPEQLVEEVLEEAFTLLMDYAKQVWQQAGLEETLQDAAENGATDVLTWSRVETGAKEALEELKQELKDVVLSLDMKGNRVVHFVVTAECQTKGTYAYEVLFALEGSYQDNMTAVLTKQGESEPLFTMLRETTNDKEQLSAKWEINTREAQLLVSGEYQKASGEFRIVLTPENALSFILEGVVTETKKGEAIAVEISSLATVENGVKETAGVELAFSLRVLKNTPQPISAEAKDILEMQENDWNALIMEVYGSLFTMLGSLGGLFN